MHQIVANKSKFHERIKPSTSCRCRSQDLNLPFWIGCHMSHQYQTGACLYFTFGGVQRDRADINTFLKLKQVATEAVLRNGGPSKPPPRLWRFHRTEG